MYTKNIDIKTNNIPLSTNIPLLKAVTNWLEETGRDIFAPPHIELQFLCQTFHTIRPYSYDVFPPMALVLPSTCWPSPPLVGLNYFRRKLYSEQVNK